MKILITSGGTREYIDDVRVLTNISSGKLGTQIAKTILMNSDDATVHYLCSKHSEEPALEWSGRLQVTYASTVQEVMREMEKIVPEVDVVIHAMAISDFGFKKESIKLKSDDPYAFIDSLKERIVINPKVITHIKTWNPDVELISFKFEVGKTKEELIDIAFKSLERNKSDYVLANDKTQMVNAGKHIAYLIDKNKDYVICENKQDISIKILKILNLK